MSAVLRPGDRLTVLNVAAGLTRRCSDAAAVAAHAGVLIEWVEAAAGRADASFRLRALWQHSCSCAAVSRSDPRPWMDDPAVFLRGAQVLYAFATASDVAGDGNASPSREVS